MHKYLLKNNTANRLDMVFVGEGAYDGVDGDGVEEEGGGDGGGG